MELHKLDSKSLGFNPVKTLYFSKNLTSLNKLIPCKCRELKRASMIHSTWSARGVIRIRRTANETALSIKNDNDLKSLYPDFVFRDRFLMTNINGFLFFVCVNIGVILAVVIFLFFYLFALIHFSEFSSSIHVICQPPINFAPTKTRIMTNLLMLLHFCFKCISGNINFDLYYIFYKCIFRIYNRIYILIFY